MENQLGEDEERKTPLLLFCCAPGLHVSRRLRLQTDHFTKTGSGNKHSESSSTQDTEACSVFCKKVGRISIRLSCARPAIKTRTCFIFVARPAIKTRKRFVFAGAEDIHSIVVRSAGYSGAGEKTSLFAPLYIKCIILPRQAQDKHRENSKKGRFLADMSNLCKEAAMGRHRETPLFAMPFTYQMHLFSKTGSGQT
eukprot:COSAG06_NODE_12707_length_1340_cov_1.032232_2_plen_196_part_00